MGSIPSWRIRLNTINNLLKEIYKKETLFSDILSAQGFPTYKINKWKTDTDWLDRFVSELNSLLIYELRNELPETDPNVISYLYGLMNGAGTKPEQVAQNIGITIEKVNKDKEQIISFLQSEIGIDVFERLVVEAADPKRKTSPVSKREVDLLLAVYDYVVSNKPGSFPDNHWLGRRLGGIEDNAIAGLKRRLKEKGYLDKRVGYARLTPFGIGLIHDLIYIPPIEIPILGQVKAGQTKQDELISLGDISDLDREELDTIPIPNIKKTGCVFALTVVGDSMENEHIFEGDYVVVQKFSDNEKPKEGELIITKYLCGADEDRFDINEVGWMDAIPEDYLEGPTLKYYFERGGRIRLSWRKNAEDSIFRIDTRFIKPIGRVINIIRRIS